MLLSMTGHGQSVVETPQVRVHAEVRSVNNRFLKTNIYSDLDVNHQSKLEQLLKSQVDRGSVNLKIKVQQGQSQNLRLNESVIKAYWLQLTEIADGSQSINLESVLKLPGIVEENLNSDAEEIWPVVEQAAKEAIKQMVDMRALEGAEMLLDMTSKCEEIQAHLSDIEELAPSVIENYSQKIKDRIASLLKKHDIQTQPADIIREVGLFAERVDISEETVRLTSHLKQFHEVMNTSPSNGRKLDFLVQEMLRETNTIGSKANDAKIASSVVAIKTAIERIREMVQNVE